MRTSFEFIGFFLASTLIMTVIVAPLYKRWYKMMRNKDDRDKANIVHPPRLF
jgi:hypothetical protein